MLGIDLDKFSLLKKGAIRRGNHLHFPW
jgi:hypothetical protein